MLFVVYFALPVTYSFQNTKKKSSDEEEPQHVKVKSGTGLLPPPKSSASIVTAQKPSPSSDDWGFGSDPFSSNNTQTVWGNHVDSLSVSSSRFSNIHFYIIILIIVCSDPFGSDPFAPTPSAPKSTKPNVDVNLLDF